MSGYYPPASFYFAVSFGSGDIKDVDAAFSEVSGLETELSFQNVMEGGENQMVHRLPGRAKATNLVLKRGLLAVNSDLVKWCNSTLESGLEEPIVPKSITVSLLGEEDEVLISWAAANAWPIKWAVDRFDASANKIAIETLEFAYSNLVRKVETPLPLDGTFQTREDQRKSG